MSVNMWLAGICVDVQPDFHGTVLIGCSRCFPQRRRLLQLEHAQTSLEFN